jgi:hypothetical protein
MKVTIATGCRNGKNKKDYLSSIPPFHNKQDEVQKLGEKQWSSFLFSYRSSHGNHFLLSTSFAQSSIDVEFRKVSFFFNS